MSNEVEVYETGKAEVIPVFSSKHVASDCRLRRFQTSPCIYEHQFGITNTDVGSSHFHRLLSFQWNAQSRPYLALRIFSVI
jgi:hypothetical protein